MAWSRAMLGMVMGLLVAALLLPAALSIRPDDELISMATDGQYRTTHPAAVSMSQDLDPDYYNVSCPGVRDVVRSAVVRAVREDFSIATNLLRMFFHDCFPQGCDASILLLGTQYSEMRLGPNLSLDTRRKVAFLMEAIRAELHAVCGPVVSCADILAIATHDAVVESGGQPYYLPLGRLDSASPAPREVVFQLPAPTLNVDELIASFSSRGLDERDLVVLSGAHTIGKAHCNTFSHRFGNEDADFVQRLATNCSSDGGRLQDLDVSTPDKFDNAYYHNLQNGEGVLFSDMQLQVNQTTRAYVTMFARNEWQFWNQFGNSMTKMGNLRGTQGTTIRTQCY